MLAEEWKGCGSCRRSSMNGCGRQHRRTGDRATRTREFRLIGRCPKRIRSAGRSRFRPALVPARRSTLIQTRPTESFQIVFAIAVVSDRHVTDEPGDRNIGLRPFKLEQGGFGHIVAARHAGGRGQYPMTADEVAALPDALGCEADRLVIIAPDKVRIGGDAAKNRREGVARAQSQRPLRRHAGLLPATAVRQGQAVITLGKREVRVET